MTGRKRAAVAAAIVTGCFGSASALGADHTGPGTAGAPGCVGQTAAFLAQVGKNSDDVVPNGLGGLAHSVDASPSNLHDLAVSICATP